MRRGAYRPGLLVAVAVALLLLPACGGGRGSAASMSVEDVLAQVDGLDGDARTKKLVELAEAEGGELSLYTTASIDLGAEVADAFEDAYGLDVSIYKAGDAQLVQRIVSERDAGFHGADVVEAGADAIIGLSQEGALQAYRSPSAADLAPGSAYDDWTADRQNVFVLARNTKLVSEEEAPKTWEELAEPKWSGRFLLIVDDYEWFKALWEHWVESGKTPAEADELAEAVARNATFVDGKSFTRQLISSGEFDVGLNFRNTVERDAEEGAPLAWEPAVRPVFSRPDGLAMVAEPPNPAAAVLFVDWLLSDGQEVYAEAKTDPVRKDLLTAPEVETVPIDIEDYVAEQEQWQQRYDELVRLGTAGPEDD